MTGVRYRKQGLSVLGEAPFQTFEKTISKRLDTFLSIQPLISLNGPLVE